MKRFSIIAAGLLGTLASAGLARCAERFTLAFPVACKIGESCVIQNFVDRDPGPLAQDYRCGAMTYKGHDGTDIRIPSLLAMRAGVAVLAAADGVVRHTRDSMPDISIRSAAANDIAGRECGNGIVIDHADGWQTQYCHLAVGSVRVRPGAKVKRGAPIARVGLSGKTEFPHLHITVRRKGRVVDPSAPDQQAGTCGEGGAPLFEGVTQADLYRDAFVLNRGFADGSIDGEAIETGKVEARRPDVRAEALVAYIRVLGLKRGDIHRLVLKAPGGEALAETSLEPLDRPKAQTMLYVGRKRAGAEPWPKGRYEAHYSVTRAGVQITDEAFSVEF